MKRHGNLFEKAFTKENLYAAYLDASRSKHRKRGCFNFEKHLASNLDRLYEQIHKGAYKPREYHMFMVYEPKPRVIYAPCFADLVVQHAIYRIILPIFDKKFIDQSYACRVGKGTHKAADYCQHALQNIPRDSYCLKLDIRKFFYRINRTILRTIIERTIKDTRFVDIMMMFCEFGDPIGIPIGNLLSQLYALIYMNILDHFVKRTLKVKKYCRYVDDFILFGLSKEKCLEYKYSIEKFLREKLDLVLSKFSITKTKKGINFVGYRTWGSRRFIRKHSLFKFVRNANKNRLESIISTLGHSRNTHSLRHLIFTLKENFNGLYLQLPKVYRQYQNG